MFVIELIYKASLAEIDAHMAAHVRFLKKHYAAGTFLVSGRKIPRDGGIILAAGKSREHIETIVREDPFVQKGLAEFRIIQFRASHPPPLACNSRELRRDVAPKPHSGEGGPHAPARRRLPEAG